VAESLESRPLNQAFLSLGSNIEPERNLPAAVMELSRHGRVRRVSSVWETVPLGFSGQPNFLNAALWLETPLPARELREIVIAGIEAQLGRVRTENRSAPRTIDIDIMLFNRESLRVGRRHPAGRDRARLHPSRDRRDAGPDRAEVRPCQVRNAAAG